MQVYWCCSFILALPDAGARPYILKMAKAITSTLSATDVYEHAKQINNINPNTLLGCIQHTATATTRKIILALFTPDELVKSSGTDAVSKPLRKKIRGKYYLSQYTVF